MFCILTINISINHITAVNNAGLNIACKITPRLKFFNNQFFPNLSIFPTVIIRIISGESGITTQSRAILMMFAIISNINVTQYNPIIRSCNTLVVTIGLISFEWFSEKFKAFCIFNVVAQM
jgi:hypothetical protein